MSRSQPTLQNPAHRFFEYKSGAGVLQYYDKEKAERIEVKLPFPFLVLDQLNTITGFSRPDKASYYSNEVRNSAKEEFVIKLKGAHVVTTLYKNEHGVVQVPKAAKYAKSIYIAYQEAGEWVIGNIRLSGSAMTSWIEFNQKHKVENGKVIMTKGAKVKGEQGDYFPPAFEYLSAEPEEDSIAITLDKALQIYLSQYLSAPKHEDQPEDEGEEEIDTKATPAQIAEFESLKAKRMKPQDSDGDDEAVETYSQVAVNEDPGFSDDDIPPEFR
jgi:hypothetical protein